MLKLTLDLIWSNMTPKFFLHLCINMMINSFLVVFIGQYATQYLISNLVTIGIYMTIAKKLISMVETKHGFYLTKQRNEFDKNVIQNIHKKLITRFTSLCWNEARKLEKDKFDQIENTARYALLSFTYVLMGQLIALFPTVGYSFWLLYNAPISFLVFGITIGISLWYFKKPEKETKERFDLWDDFNIENDKKLNRMIHLEGKQSIEKTNGIIGKRED